MYRREARSDCGGAWFAEHAWGQLGPLHESDLEVFPAGGPNASNAIQGCSPFQRAAPF